MNPSTEKPLAPASPSEATLSLAAQDISEATRKALPPAALGPGRMPWHGCWNGN